jgi:hypothetical protein
MKIDVLMCHPKFLEGKHMSVSKGNESWRRFADHEGTDNDTRTAALRQQRARQGHSGLQSGANLERGAPIRFTKHRGKQRFEGVRIS